MNMRTVLLTMLLLGQGDRGGSVQPPAPEMLGVVLATYDRHPDYLDDEPELASAIADVREAVTRRDASLVEPWLADGSSRILGAPQGTASQSAVLTSLRVMAPALTAIAS